MAEIGLTSLFVEKDNLFGMAGDLDISIREAEARLKERAKHLSAGYEQLASEIALFRDKIRDSQEETARELSQYEVEELHFLSWEAKTATQVPAPAEENPCRKLLQAYIREHRPVILPVSAPVEIPAPVEETPAPEEIFEEVSTIEAPEEALPPEEEIFSLDAERLAEYYGKIYQYAQDRECFYELPAGPVMQTEETHVAQDTVSLETVELEPLEKAIQQEKELLAAQEDLLPEEMLDKTVQRPLSFIKKLEEASLRLREEEETDISLI